MTMQNRTLLGGRRGTSWAKLGKMLRQGVDEIREQRTAKLGSCRDLGNDHQRRCAGCQAHSEEVA